MASSESPDGVSKSSAAQTLSNHVHHSGRPMRGMLVMFLRGCILFALLSIRCVAQIPETSRADFEIPGGSIFGAALSKDGSVLYAQQYLSDDSAGASRQHIVKISSWDVKRKATLVSKSFPESHRSQTFPCRRTLLGATSGHLYVCSDRTSIRILDGKELTTFRTLQYPSEGTIHDFAIETKKTLALSGASIPRSGE
jgi:hypothetical protein